MTSDGYEIILADLIGGQQGTVTGGGGGGAVSDTTASTVQTDAGAENTDAAQQAAGPSTIVMWVVIYGGLFFALWFFMFRPQRKKQKEQKRMLDELKAGENVVTTSGFYGKIVNVGSDCFLVEFGEGRGVRVWVRKSEIAGIKEPIMTPPAENS